MTSLVFLLTLLLLPAGSVRAVAPTAGECTGPSGSGPSRCLYRSLLPSAGIVASCTSDRDCRVGYYYGDPGAPTWIAPPEGMPTLPRPEVIWRTATLAQVRFDCGAPCTVSYFFEARRRRLSPPRRFVLDVDPRRLLLAAAEGRALVVRQVFSGREVARVERDWAAGEWLGQAITALSFDPDGRLRITWLKGSGRQPVSERILVPSVPR